MDILGKFQGRNQTAGLVWGNLSLSWRNRRNLALLDFDIRRKTQNKDKIDWKVIDFTTDAIPSAQMQEVGSHYAAFSKISAGEPNLKLAASEEQESSPLLRSAARTPRKAGNAETASSHSRS